jgi:hypothetical protein
MKKLILMTLIILASQLIHAQKYMTQNGIITFYSKTPMEDIEAVNNQVSSVFDGDNGGIAASLLMKAFTFEKALMQEHFNEKYIESDKFPKSTFKGSIENFDKLKLSSSATNITVKGQLTIHGVTKEIVASGTMSKVDENTLKAQFTFSILLSDYQVKIPSTVKDNISESIKITTNFTYKKV